MSERGRLGEYQLDVLKEVGNIGAAHAATALSTLLQRSVEMKVPSVNFLPFDQIAESAGGAEEVVAAVFLRVEGDAPGNMFFIVSAASAKRLLSGIAPESRSGDYQFSEMEISALSEIGNILAGSYLSSLGDFTTLRLAPSVPSLAIDMAGAILAYGLLQYGEMGDQALLIETAFYDDGDQVDGNFFFIPDPESYTIIFRSLGVPPE
ncbi:chemotaxis protein CheC [Paenibacillus thermotolerans]|uniref:chemotaxis protein CheC n=1 Tax=Paenibacillus thermotolerans TaxID=3027807 RepID=UPI002367F5A1|nr:MULTISPECIES: chemotaxis protein CheC [unclassified Paenibacillus]